MKNIFYHCVNLINVCITLLIVLVSDVHHFTLSGSTVSTSPITMLFGITVEDFMLSWQTLSEIVEPLYWCMFCCSVCLFVLNGQYNNDWSSAVSHCRTLHCSTLPLKHRADSQCLPANSDVDAAAKSRWAGSQGTTWSEATIALGRLVSVRAQEQMCTVMQSLVVEWQKSHYHTLEGWAGDGLSYYHLWPQPSAKWTKASIVS